MRISDWSSDVCSSDLHRAVTVLHESLKGQIDARVHETVVSIGNSQPDPSRSFAVNPLFRGKLVAEKIAARSRWYSRSWLYVFTSEMSDFLLFLVEGHAGQLTERIIDLLGDRVRIFVCEDQHVVGIAEVAVDAGDGANGIVKLLHSQFDETGGQADAPRQACDAHATMMLIKLVQIVQDHPRDRWLIKQ